jgi:DNA methylase
LAPTIGNRAVKRLPDIWHRAPRRWGHLRHAMCSYMAMFPPTIPHVFIRWLTAPGNVVYDPFSGRGTTVLEACNQGRIGVGSDANPLAWVLTAAKAAPPSPRALQRRLADLRAREDRDDPSTQSAEIQAVFDRDVLGQLLWLRGALSVRSAVDRFLYAVLLGVLHANARTDGTPRGLSISMPNTFSMAPRYVMRYKAEHRLVPPKVNVLERLTSRIAHLGDKPAGFRAGHAWLQDVTQPIRIPSRFARPKLIFTSPPYLGVMKYGKLNWLRLWLLGHEPKIVDRGLFASGSLDAYTGFMTTAIAGFSEVLRDDGFLCLVIGDVRRPKGDINLAKAVADRCVAGSGLKVLELLEDELPTGQKVSRIWKERHGRATKTDRILILGGPKAGRLPSIPAIDWTASADQEKSVG